MSKSYEANLVPSETREFYKLWRQEDRDGLLSLCNRVRERWNVPSYSREKFDEGWQWRTVLHKDRKTAWEEFFNLCYGWW